MAVMDLPVSLSAQCRRTFSAARALVKRGRRAVAAALEQGPGRHADSLSVGDALPGPEPAWSGRVVGLLRQFRVAALLLGLCFGGAIAQALPKITLSVADAQSPKDVSVSLQILFLITILALAPSIIMMMTAFVRLVVVFSFLRRALGTQTMPPDQILVGLSLFLTVFIMMPVFTQMNSESLQPYLAQKITWNEALDKAVTPVRAFMLRQVNEKDIALFVRIAKKPLPRTVDDLTLDVIIPAFITSELKTAFIIGFLLYIPFLVIDMIVASVLLSMGMMMLPPIMISMPFKIILFVLVDGWNLIVKELVMSFR